MAKPTPEPSVKAHALKFLREHSSAVLVTASGHCEPEAATMYYDVNDDLTFYFIASKDSRKVHNLQHNPRVAFVVGFGPAPITVQGGGVATLNHSVKLPLFGSIVAKIKLHHIDQLPMMRLNPEAFVTITVKPTWLVWLNLDKPDHPEAYGNHFHHLIGTPADHPPA